MRPTSEVSFQEKGFIPIATGSVATAARSAQEEDITMSTIITNGKLSIALGTALMLVSLSAPAHAAKLKQFLANLNAGQQSPPNSTTGLGVAHFTFDETTKMLCFAITY